MNNGTAGPRGDPRVHNDEERKAVHVILCAASVAGWRLFCERHGVSLTGLLDAAGHTVATLEERDLSVVAPTMAAALTEARRIDVNRRLRPKG